MAGSRATGEGRGPSDDDGRARPADPRRREPARAATAALPETTAGPARRDGRSRRPATGPERPPDTGGRLAGSSPAGRPPALRHVRLTRARRLRARGRRRRVRRRGTRPPATGPGRRGTRSGCGRTSGTGRRHGRGGGGSSRPRTPTCHASPSPPTVRSLGRIGLAVGRPPSMASKRCSMALVTSGSPAAWMKAVR